MVEGEQSIRRGIGPTGGTDALGDATATYRAAALDLLAGPEVRREHVPARWLDDYDRLHPEATPVSGVSHEFSSAVAQAVAAGRVDWSLVGRTDEELRQIIGAPEPPDLPGLIEPASPPDKPQP